MGKVKSNGLLGTVASAAILGIAAIALSLYFFNELQVKPNTSFPLGRWPFLFFSLFVLNGGCAFLCRALFSSGALARSGNIFIALALSSMSFMFVSLLIGAADLSSTVDFGFGRVSLSDFVTRALLVVTLLAFTLVSLLAWAHVLRFTAQKR